MRKMIATRTAIQQAGRAIDDETRLAAMVEVGRVEELLPKVEWWVVASAPGEGLDYWGPYESRGDADLNLRNFGSIVEVERRS